MTKAHLYNRFPKKEASQKDDIKRISRKQLQSNHFSWQCLTRKHKKEMAKEITFTILAKYKKLDSNKGYSLKN